MNPCGKCWKCDLNAKCIRIMRLERIEEKKMNCIRCNVMPDTYCPYCEAV